MSTLFLNYYVFDPAGRILRSIISAFGSTFPGKSQWDADKIPDLRGDVAIVTGGNAGIGRETCKVYAGFFFFLLCGIADTFLGTSKEERQGLSRRKG